MAKYHQKDRSMSFVSATSTTASVVPGSTSTNSGLSGISSEDFLTLLITQLKHQDPLSPADPGQTVQQLASLSQVSSLQEISATIQQLLDRQDAAFDPASWLGRVALVPSRKALPLDDGSYSGEIQIDNADAVDVQFTDANGVVVHTEHLAGPITGQAAFNWSGSVDGVRVPGPLTVSAKANTGAAVTIAVWTPVESVRTPALSTALLETPLGLFTPDTVLDLK
jgi:flagellar basal-body rod modification protein FlgD